MNIGAEVAGFLVRLVQLGIAASEEQAKEMILAHLQASPPDIAKDYFAARAVLAQAKSDADELELRGRRIRDETLGVTPHRDTVPAPPDTLRILDPHDHDDGEG